MSDIIMEVEQEIESAVYLIEIADRIILPTMKYTYYTQALGILKKIEEKSSEKDKWLRVVRTKRNRSKIDILLSAYNEADLYYGKTKKWEDFDKAATNFEQITELLKRYNSGSDLIDISVLTDSEKEIWTHIEKASEEAEKCRERSRLLFRKKRALSYVTAGIIVVVALFVLFGVNTSTFQIAKGKWQLKHGQYNSAANSFDKAYQRHNSKKTQQLYYEVFYEQAKHALEIGDYDHVNAYVKNIPDGVFSDLNAIRFKAELGKIADTETWKKIIFARDEWIILDRQGSDLLLLKMNGFSHGSFQGENENGFAWKESGIREYLNSDFINEKFNDNEQKCIVEKSVMTDGVETFDRLFLLSEEEFEKYSPHINKTSHCYWLRSKGEMEGTAAFIDVEKNIMKFGYKTDTEAMSIRPAMWINIDWVK